jgi:AraC family transcriptional activator of pobA
MSHIPIHILQDRTKNGFQIKHVHSYELKEDLSAMDVHRDDHYIFFLLEDGLASLSIDFTEVVLKPKSIFYVLPGQVHFGHVDKSPTGWFVAIDTALVPQECSNVFENQLVLQQPYTFTEGELEQCELLLKLLLKKHKEETGSPFYITIVHSLLQAFIGVAAGYYTKSTSSNSRLTRPAQITVEFKKLLNEYIRTIKSPADFAYKLNISEAYLSEVLKKQTGFSASYWIQQEVVMEAKRLLYYSELGVKEIAHDLGYSDHSYFSRFFKKVTGVSALTFRQQYRY